MVALNKSVVLVAAVEHLDEVGLDRFSARQVAARLGVRVGALYWHYPSKQSLLDAIADGIAVAAAEVTPTGTWDERLSACARSQRSAMLAHTDGARVIAEMRDIGPMAREFMGRLILVLQDAGLDQRDAAAAADVVTSFVNGFTIEEQARKLQQAKAVRDRTFDFGLTVVIDGLRQLS